MLLHKRASQSHDWKFILFASVLILMATSATRSFAAPMVHTVTGHITGTITLDFMLASGTSPAAFAWDLEHTALAVSWSSLTDVSSNSTRLFIPTTPLVQDFIQFNTTNTDGIRLGSVWLGPASMAGAPNTYRGNITSPTGQVVSINGSYSTAPIPAPTSSLLLATGLLGLAGYRWQQRRHEGIQLG